MITRKSSVQAYHDRTGRYTLFHDAINQLATKRHGDSWTSPISCHKPQSIPRYKSQANIQQILFAADIVLHHRPLAEITQVSYIGDEAWIGIEKPFDLNISDEDWLFAHTKSDQCSEQWDKEFDDLSYILEAFCISAANQKLKCYTRYCDSVDLRDLASEMWNVGSEVLWSRYVTGCLDIYAPFSKREDGRYMILVDSKDKGFLEALYEIYAVESRDDVIAELEIAATKNPYAAPGNDKVALIRSIAKRLRIPQKDARHIVDSIRGQQWDRRGPRPKEGKSSNKSIHKG